MQLAQVVSKIGSDGLPAPSRLLECTLILLKLNLKYVQIHKGPSFCSDEQMGAIFSLAENMTINWT